MNNGKRIKPISNEKQPKAIQERILINQLINYFISLDHIQNS